MKLDFNERKQKRSSGIELIVDDPVFRWQTNWDTKFGTLLHFSITFSAYCDNQATITRFLTRSA